MPSRVLIFTGTRAEAGLLAPVARACAENKSLRASWLVSGTHALQGHGDTLDDVRQSGVEVAETVPFFSSPDQAHGHPLHTLASDMGKGLARLADALDALKPGWLVVLGDRVESFAAASAAFALRIPVAHLHGGDRIESGHMDEAFRHAITRFAALHFAASEGSAERLRKFGEEEWRIHMTGAPGLDRLSALKSAIAGRERQVLSRHGVPADARLLLVIFHPVSAELGSMESQAHELFGALDARPEHKLAIFPNNDPGHEAIEAALLKRQAEPRWSVERNLGPESYAAAMSVASAFVGNSSSGVIEAPLFGLPFVHIGTRNQGREQAGHVVFVTPVERMAIDAAISQATRPEAHERVAKLINPYGSGDCGQKVARLLEAFSDQSHPMHSRLLHKRVAY